MWKFFEKFGKFQNFRVVGESFRICRKIGKKIYFTQMYCENNRSNLKSIKKPKKRAKEKVGETLRARWVCCEDSVGALKMKIDFFCKIR